jgi:hypothetical protein
MKIVNYMLLSLLLVGCGSDSEDKSAASTSPESDIYHTDEVSNVRSISLKEKSDLPECLEANDTQLAYVIDEEAFYVCESSEWVEADIKGKDGERGADGNNGSDGQDGTPSNQWLDPNDGKTWLIGGNGAWTVSFCPAGWTRPNVWEGTAAVAHGLLVASAQISGPDDIWTINFDVSSNLGQYVDVNGAWVYSPKTDSRGMFCYKN